MKWLRKEASIFSIVSGEMRYVSARSPTSFLSSTCVRDAVVAPVDALVALVDGFGVGNPPCIDVDALVVAFAADGAMSAERFSRSRMLGVANVPTCVLLACSKACFGEKTAIVPELGMSAVADFTSRLNS